MLPPLSLCLHMHTKGATGFGSAILHSLVWIIFTSAGIDGGTLLQSVVVECIYGVVLSVPLLFLMDAFRSDCCGETSGRPCMGSPCGCMGERQHGAWMIDMEHGRMGELRGSAGRQMASLAVI